MNGVNITGVVFIVLYFVLYYFIQRRKSRHVKPSSIDSSKDYSDLLNLRLKEDVVLIGIWGLLVTGIFLCLIGLYQ